MSVGEKRESLENDNKWNNLEHNGVLFAEDFHPTAIPIKYKGATLQLTTEQEEVATFWVQTIGTDWEKKKTYRNNFLETFTKLLGEQYYKKEDIKLEDFDFTSLHKHHTKLKEEKKNLTTEQKKKIKIAKEEEEKQVKWAIMDGFAEKTSNVRLEPSTLFKGRGDHPRAGVVKERVMPEDIELNLGKLALVPKCPLPGRCWKSISFNKEASYLASFPDALGNKKYIALANTSRIKFEADIKKFETAKNLGPLIEDIRKKYYDLLKSEKLSDRQLGAAVYIIDRLAIRAGNDKKEDEADTVGCCSLRVEHITFGEENNITLDFLGKDSIRYLNTVKIDPLVFSTLKISASDKKKDKPLFETLNSSRLNEFLSSLMPDLTAKVFRTFNASSTLENQLLIVEKKIKKNHSNDEKMKLYNEANREVAILCNHQKAEPKNFRESISKLEVKVKELKKKMKGMKKEDKARSKLKERIKKEENNLEERMKNKTIALGTSKTNYNDPRISVAFCKRVNLPLEKVFPKVLLAKFTWALDTDKSWRFSL